MSVAGFVCAVNKTPIAVGWHRMYQMSYIVNASIAAVVFYVLSRVFPPIGTGISEPWDRASVDSSSLGEPELEGKEGLTVQVERLTPARMV